MHTRSGDTTVKLRHLQDLRVLLCEACGYCVLLRALNRHLKDIHSLRASERRQYLNIAKKLRLADGDGIVYPSPGGTPIQGLPVLDGYACQAVGCEHLCATRKRMEAHWSQDHNTVGQAMQQLSCRPVRLQTLFRGNLLRYFEVARPSTGDTASGLNVGLVQRSSLPPSPLPSEGPNTILDWRLIEDFLGDGHLALLPTKGALPSWRDQMMQVSAGLHYLRLAILSAVAGRIAFAHRDTRDYYRPAADRYRQAAIQSLPDMSTLTLRESFFPLFHFSRLMTVCCIARVQSRHLGLDDQHDEPQWDESILPEWVPVQRQGRALTWHHRGGGRIATAIHGPPQRLTPLYPVAESGFAWNPDDDKLELLVTRLDTELSTAADPACMESLELLRHVWSLPYQEPLCGFRDVALMWTARVPQRYLELLQDHDPVAVVIFAFYCVLWGMAEEQYWYMQGHASRMLLKAYQCLDHDLQTWLDWPMLMVWGGVHSDSGTSTSQVEEVSI